MFIVFEGISKASPYLSQQTPSALSPNAAAERLESSSQRQEVDNCSLPMAFGEEIETVQN